MKRLASAVVTPTGPNYTQSIEMGGFSLLSDEPLGAGGQNAGLNEEQWLKLLDIASKTPVTKTLLAGASIATRQAEVA